MLEYQIVIGVKNIDLDFLQDHQELTEKIIKIFYRVYNKLLLNFGPKPQIKRKVFDNNRK